MTRSILNADLLSYPHFGQTKNHSKNFQANYSDLIQSKLRGFLRCDSYCRQLVTSCSKITRSLCDLIKLSEIKSLPWNLNVSWHFVILKLALQMQTIIYRMGKQGPTESYGELYSISCGKPWWKSRRKKNICVCIYIYIYTHTHTHMYTTQVLCRN